jgi:hypothetical protein
MPDRRLRVTDGWSHQVGCARCPRARFMPAGPFLAYDRQGNLVRSVYMIPLRDLRAGTSFKTLAAAKAKADHVDIYYNNGHAGVPDPHYHRVLWYISPEQVETLQ